MTIWSVILENLYFETQYIVSQRGKNMSAVIEG